MARQYHIGFGKRGRTLVIEARRCVDYLDCEIYDYMGVREITKRELNQNRYEILRIAKGMNPDVYGELRYAVVD